MRVTAGKQEKLYNIAGQSESAGLFQTYRHAALSNGTPKYHESRCKNLQLRGIRPTFYISESVDDQSLNDSAEVRCMYM